MSDFWQRLLIMKLSLEQKFKFDLKFWSQFWSPYNKFWLNSTTIISISSWHTASLSKRPSPYLTSKFLHKYFPHVNAPVSSISSVVFINMYTGRYYSLIRWPPLSRLVVGVLLTERRFKRRYSESGIVVQAPSKYRPGFVVWEWRR